MSYSLIAPAASDYNSDRATKTERPADYIAQELCLEIICHVRYY